VASGNLDHWDKLGYVRIGKDKMGSYPEKGVLILNIYPNGISYRISHYILFYPDISYICIVYPGTISCILSCNDILQDIVLGYPIYQYIS
jgi:hypothetical protein